MSKDKALWRLFKNIEGSFVDIDGYVVEDYFPSLKKADGKCLVHPSDLKMETIAEKAIAVVSGLTWCGYRLLPYDFVEDKSDCKTSSCTENNTKRKYTAVSGEVREYEITSYTGSIQGVESKVGTLRVIVYNAHKNACDFFLIPQKHIIPLSDLVSGSDEKRRINYSYDRGKDTYSKIEGFRVDTFEDVCK